MHVSWTIPPALEEQLRQLSEKGDHESLRRLVGEQVTPLVEAMLAPVGRELSDEEFEKMMAEIDAIVDSSDSPPLSDYAVSREGIYGDHP